MLKLYHNDMSACAQKVRFVLAVKQLEWQSKELNLRQGDQLRPEYLKINPKGLVPALEHDGNILVESNIIVDYLDEAFPQPSLMPETPLQRAKVRWWMKKLDDGLHLELAALSFGIAYRILMILGLIHLIILMSLLRFHQMPPYVNLLMITEKGSFQNLVISIKAAALVQM